MALNGGRPEVACKATRSDLKYYNVNEGDKIKRWIYIDFAGKSKKYYTCYMIDPEFSMTFIIPFLNLRSNTILKYFDGQLSNTVENDVVLEKELTENVKSFSDPIYDDFYVHKNTKIN